MPWSLFYGLTALVLVESNELTLLAPTDFSFG